MNIKLITLWIGIISSPLYLFAKNDDISEKEKQVIFRQIGNRILWLAGDSTSRVLPIEKKNDNTYIISFERKLNIVSDSLYKIIAQELQQKGEFHFVVELKDCNSGKVFASFFHSPTDTLTPCAGRQLPVNCYTLEITLQEKKNISWWWLALFILPLSVSFAYFLRNKTKIKNQESFTKTAFIQIGHYQFYEQKRMLHHPSQNIELTEKETHLLSLLLKNINEVQNKDFLMDELWGKNGVVVVPKNLDVLVSRLRKKLLLDEKIKIVNSHGIGYKLEYL
ncbi:MAG: helix-turn-helix domain-containing protein [Raineya sp.]|jgi:hypothetical protein|nr:helix-turn-helix domain-containing protein [Raineya sp.]